MDIFVHICVRVFNLFVSECKTKHVRLVPACQSANLRRGKSLTCATCNRSSSANEGHFLSVCLLLNTQIDNILKEIIPQICIQRSNPICHQRQISFSKWKTLVVCMIVLILEEQQSQKAWWGLVGMMFLNNVSVSNDLDDRELVQIQHMYVLGCPHIFKVGFAGPARTTTKRTQIKLV